MSKLTDLKKTLFEAYKGFSDKRLKDISKGSTFIIDDRTARDVGADKKLYSYFCKVFVAVEGENVISVKMSGNVPKGASVTKWMSENEHEYTDAIVNSLLFKITPHDFDKLISLASAIDDIVKPGERYGTPSYKYVCPRTSKSLLRLHNLLSKVWLK